MNSLDIVGGRVLDPGRGIDAVATVSVGDGVVTSIDTDPQRGGDRFRG